MSQSQREKFAARFREFLPAESVVDQPTSLAAYECDGLSAYRQTPLLVLCGKDLYHPESTSRVIAEIAPNASFIEDWKEGSAREAARAEVLAFLKANS